MSVTVHLRTVSEVPRFGHALDLRIVLLESGRAAAVHPSSGAWVVLEDPSVVEAVKKNCDSSYPSHHLRLSPSSPIYPEIWAACEDYRSRATAEDSSGKLDTVILKLTNRCNEACLHCYDACGHSSADADEAMLDRTLSQALEICGPHLTVLFHGGEPMLVIDKLDRVATRATSAAAARGKSIGFFVQTNASIINDRIVAILQKHDIGIGISIDGWPEIHDKFRVMADGKGTYRLFRRSYERHRDYLTRNSGILTTVSALNVEHIERIVRHVLDLGFRTWDATLFDLNGRGALFPELAVDPDKYCDALGCVLDGIEAGVFDCIAIKPILTRLDNLLTPKRFNMCVPGNGRCGAGSRLASVSAHGEISGCDILHDHALALGSMSTTTLDEALASPLAEVLRGRHDLLRGCHGCTWLGVCGGTCLARSTLSKLNPIDCRISMRINEELLNRLASGDRLLTYYNLFPPSRRRASVIADSE